MDDVVKVFIVFKGKHSKLTLYEADILISQVSGP